MVMYHGGGFFMGDLDTETSNCAILCEHMGFVVVDVDYRLAPEYPFPTGINDSWDALQWVKFPETLIYM
jgi:acetyl esterase/lipase